MLKVQVSGGGLDSSALTVLEGMDLIVHIDYGQTAAHEELSAIHRVLRHTNQLVPVVSVDVSEDFFFKNMHPNLLMGTGDQPFIRGRNLMLLMIAAQEALKNGRCLTLYLGLCRENMMFEDANESFVTIANQTLNRAFGTNEEDEPVVSVLAPYINVPKEQFMRDAYSVFEKRKDKPMVVGLENGHNLFSESFTCWTPVNGEECGTCYHCEKKAKLLKKVVEPDFS